MLSVRVATKGLRAIMLAASAAQEFRYRWMTFLDQVSLDLANAFRRRRLSSTSREHARLQL